jgi:hypothetical protein
MRARKAMLVAAALLCANAFAGDLAPDEKKWVGECVANLASKSAIVRGSAEKAVAGLGLDALPTVVAASAKLKTDADWQALGRAVAAMGAGMRKAVDDLRMSWPKGTETRYAAMLDFLEKAEEEAKQKASIGGSLPTSPADIRAAVREILESFRGKDTYVSDCPEVRRIVAMGHDAFGALLEFLKEDETGHENWAGRDAAGEALDELVVAADVPALAGLLLSGRTKFAQALARLGTPDAVAALALAIDRNFVDSDLVSAFDRHDFAVKLDPKIVSAFVRWLGRPAADKKQYEVGSVAEMLAKAGAVDAVASLAKRLSMLDQLQPKQRVAQALVDLGDKSGIPALIEVLTMPEPFAGPMRFDYPRHCAGLALNKIAGKDIYTGKEVAAGPGGIPGLGPAEPRYDADFPATAKAFRAWWEKTKDKLVFDAATRTWSAK